MKLMKDMREAGEGRAGWDDARPVEVSFRFTARLGGTKLT